MFFFDFLTFIKKIIFLISTIWDPRDQKIDFFNDASKRTEGLFKAFETHQSFDTYFKKLFHTNQFKKISEAKKEWQASWNKFLELLMVLEKLEI